MTKQARLNAIIKNLATFYREDKIKLVKFLRKENYTLREIGDVLSVDESAISHLLAREAK